MKRFAKTAAVFVALAGLLCMSSCSTLGIPNVFDLLFGSSSASSGSTIGDTVAEWKRLDNAKYELIDLCDDGSCIGFDGGAKGKIGTWSGSINDGETLTVTLEATTYSGTVRGQGYDAVVTLGAWGSYKRYVSDK
ncbi:MAG: hypothetical protein K2I95_11705 [Treponemataceae bacterium]|nr:hypothetical protein [Treponemataceae bacterium]MDE6736017.1 hypothetical protein [Treponemataceae bacterium]